MPLGIDEAESESEESEEENKNEEEAKEEEEEEDGKKTPVQAEKKKKKGAKLFSGVWNITVTKLGGKIQLTLQDDYGSVKMQFSWTTVGQKWGETDFTVSGF